MANGALAKWSVPDQIVARFHDIRKAMVRPDTIAWFTAKYEIKYPGKSRFQFNSTDEPKWTNPPSDDDYTTELERHPRDPEKIPDWFPTRSA
ncbi:hypothetical protein [Saccharopolyspora hordei]|uniref:Uncharacterized protein n=1 Tax=Saccharopolyspora hordei TaxID=1838 RepID=A0A853AU33_9PSEU|nr:hypothetical protein [Saccharopolyspora hordei]NYI86155.1 hypothetical protein [Saccharopolyspora hordei]